MSQIIRQTVVSPLGQAILLCQPPASDVTTLNHARLKTLHDLTEASTAPVVLHYHLIGRTGQYSRVLTTSVGSQTAAVSVGEELGAVRVL